MLKMTEDWRKNIYKEVAAAVATNLSKAFDDINHRLFLAKLKAFGFSPPALELMASFLLGRQQYIRIEGVCSNFRTVKTCVPQGSLLSPLLFNVFIDLNFCTLNVSLNKDLQTRSSWFECNHLTVNIATTQALSVGLCDYDYSLLLNDARINFSNPLRFFELLLTRTHSTKNTYRIN